jgi:hypothetical protein
MIAQIYKVLKAVLTKFGLGSYFCTNCSRFVSKDASTCLHCGGIAILIDWKKQFVTEEKVCNDLINAAQSAARNKKIQGYLSEMKRALFYVTNEVYTGRSRFLCKDGIEDPFPKASELREKLSDILVNYCMQSDVIPSGAWEKGWETEVIPAIDVLAAR